MLNKTVFQALVDMWGVPKIDLFASHLNHQVAAYVAWKPDPEAVTIDSLSLQWDYLLLYAFPPFSLIRHVLRKIELEHCEGIVVVPYWTTQPWYSKLMHMLIDCPFLLPRKDLLSHPTLAEHSLPKMDLIACRVSGVTKPGTFSASFTCPPVLMARHHQAPVQDVPSGLGSIRL